MSILKPAACVLLLSSIAIAQSAPHFEVASVRPSADQGAQTGLGIHVDGSQLRVTGFTLKNYVGVAYRVRPQQIVAPEWLGQLRFDVAAKIPEGVPAAQVPAMLQSLLEERFQMKAHKETREFPVYALRVAAGGVAMKESAPRPDAPAGTSPTIDVKAGGDASGSGADLGSGSSFLLTDTQIQVQRFTMRTLAELLTRLSTRPVIDETNNTKVYDAALDLTSEEILAVKLRAAVNSDAILPPQALRLLDTLPADPLSNALQKVGLLLVSNKAPLDVVVVDSMQKAPTEN